MINADLIITDLDGCLYESKKTSFLSLDQILYLDKKHPGLWKKTRYVFEEKNGMSWEEKVRKAVDFVCDERISFDDYVESGRYVVKNSEIDKNMKDFLRLVNPPELDIFTLSGTEPVMFYAEEKIRPILPDTRINVGGTSLYYQPERPNIITGIRKMWGPLERAKEAERLAKNKKTIVIGNEKRDLPMLKVGDVSFFITKEEQKKEDNIIYTSFENILSHVKQ